MSLLMVKAASKAIVPIQPLISRAVSLDTARLQRLIVIYWSKHYVQTLPDTIQMPQRTRKSSSWMAKLRYDNITASKWA